MKAILSICFVFFLSLSSVGQDQIIRNQSVKVFDSTGIELKLPWAGGFNSVNLSPIDLNMDGVDDLFAYDLTGGRISTFINNGTNGVADYSYAPEYIDKFPKNIQSFALFVDYNNDNKNDLFTYSNGGIKVFKNMSSVDNGLEFKDITEDTPYPHLRSKYNSGPAGTANLFLSRGDIPAICDIDLDGDIDILAFGSFATTVVFHENLAADSNDLETFNFEVATSCWGNFEEDFVSSLINLNISCKGGGTPPPPNGKGNKHAGSTLLAFDYDGDRDKDLLVGDISLNNMTLLINGGDSSFANIISKDSLFHSSKNLDITTFPAAYHLDINNDGAKDLLFGPNTIGSVENEKSVWLYENSGSDAAPSFSFTQEDFMQNEMIEMGEGNNPVLFDYNNDGLEDLLVGNHGIYNDILLPASKLYLYQNNGANGFQLITRDFGDVYNLELNANLMARTLDLAPAFGDLDGDGDKDMLLGDFEGKLHHFENVARLGQSAEFELRKIKYKDIDVGGYAVPQLFDLNQDGKLDLLIGERDGTINYYQNIGSSKEPNFELITEELGGVDVKPPLDFVGYSYPFFFNSGNEIKLFCGSQSGRIYYYDNIKNNLDGTFNVIDTAFGGLHEGNRSTVVGGDIDNDSILDLFIGNYSGGVALFNSNIAFSRTSTIVSKGDGPFDFNISPVPSFDNKIKLTSILEGFAEKEFNIEIFDTHGKKVYERKNITNKELELDLSNGIFYLKLIDGSTSAVKKFIIL